MSSKNFGAITFVSVFLFSALTVVSAQGTEVFEGSWFTVPSTTLGMQFLLGGGGVSAGMIVFSGNKCSIGVMQGTLGLGSTKTWEGTFQVNGGNKTLALIDDFGDVDTYRYVISETEEDWVLKLKDAAGEITTWYKNKPK